MGATSPTADSPAVEVRLLGRFELIVGGQPVDIRSPKERALLARMALEPGAVVSSDALIEALWPGDDRPEDPMRALRYHVWHLRGLLDPKRTGEPDAGLVVTRHPGYLLAIDRDAVDAVRVEHRWRDAQSDGHDPSRRKELLAEAIAAWGPSAFGDPDARGPLEEEATRLDRLRLTVIEDRIAAEFEVGAGSELVGELEQLVAEHPFRERMRGQLMVALYRAGRQADALAAFSAGRKILGEELGIEPGPELRALEDQILLHDPALLSPAALRAGTSSNRGNVPIPIDSFVGREAEVAEIHQLIQGHRLVTLTGVGGTGKTRLAIEAVQDLKAPFAEGVWLVELAPVLDMDKVATAIAEIRGLRAGEVSMDEVVVTYLRSRQLLLIVDNCEHVLAGAGPLIRRVLQLAPQIRVLATSRESLGIPGEIVLRVPSLGFEVTGDGRPDAVTLFIDRASSSHPGWDPNPDDLDAIRRICERVDGIPLGIELAAAHLRSMTAVELADHLNSSFRLLAGAAKTVPPRQRTLAATIDWSHGLLSAPERAVFRRCSVFAGDFTMKSAEAVCAGDDLDGEDVVAHIDSLVDKSLLIAHDAGDTRYRALEPVRQWARERLIDAGEEPRTRKAHALHYASIVDQLAPSAHGHGQAEAQRRLQADYSNIRAALATLVEIGDIDRFLDVAFGLMSFWAHQGMHLEGYETCQRGLDLATDDTDLERQVKVAFVGSLNAGWTRRRVALDIAERCRTLADRLGDPRAMGWAEYALAAVHANHRSPSQIGESAEVLHLRRARELFEANPGPAWWDPTWERGIQHLVYSSFLPAVGERLKEFQVAREALTSVGDRAWLALLLAQCLAHFDIERPEVLEAYLREGIDIGVSPWWANVCRYRLGLLRQLQGDHTHAVEYLERALRFVQATGDYSWTREARHLSVSRAELGELREAMSLLESAFETVGTVFDYREVRRTLAASAYVLVLMGEPELAAISIGAAFPIQDQFANYLAPTRARLEEMVGAERLASLEATGGAAENLEHVVTRIRERLRAGI